MVKNWSIFWLIFIELFVRLFIGQKSEIFDSTKAHKYAFAGRKCTKVHFRYLEGIFYSFNYFSKKWQCFCSAEKFCRIFRRQKREFPSGNSPFLRKFSSNFWMDFLQKRPQKWGPFWRDLFQIWGFGQNLKVLAKFGQILVTWRGKKWAKFGHFLRDQNGPKLAILGPKMTLLKVSFLAQKWALGQSYREDPLCMTGREWSLGFGAFSEILENFENFRNFGNYFLFTSVKAHFTF